MSNVKSKENFWNWEMFYVINLAIKFESKGGALYGIIIASRAHNLCNLSKGLTLPTVSLVKYYFHVVVFANMLSQCANVIEYYFHMVVFANMYSKCAL